MKIHSIRLKNLNSLRSDVVIDFEAEPLSHTGLFAITGDTGAGKTTILDAVTLAFFGRTSRDHEKEVMSNGATEASAEVVFGTDKGRFLARWVQKRTKSKDQPLKTLRELARWHDNVWITLETGRKVDSTAKEKGAVEGVLGLNYEQFKRTVLLAQGEFAAFLKADEKDRAAVLERLTNTEDYSLLSRPADLKALEERRLLEQLQVRRQAIAVLSEEQLVALQQNLQEREEQALIHHRDRETWRANLGWLDALEGLRRRQQELLTETADLESARAAFAPDLARLEQHRRTAAFEMPMARLQELEGEQEALAAAHAELLGRETETRAETGRQEELARSKQAEFEAAEGEAAADEAVFTRVAGLDQALIGQQALVQLLQNGLADLEEKCRDLGLRLVQAREDQDRTTGDQTEVQQWLADHAVEANLSADLNSLRSLYAPRLMNLQAELGPVVAAKNEGETQREALRQKLEQASLNLEAAGNRREQLQEQWLRQTAGLGLPAEERDAETELDRWVEHAATRLQSLEDFSRYQGAYRRIAGELGEIKDTQAHVLSEDYTLGKELLSVLDLLEELQRKVDIKRRRYHEELRKADYHRDRSALRDGEPCPLCGAVHHPLAMNEGAAAFVHDAEAEFESAEQQLKTAEKRHSALSGQHASLRDRLGDLQEDLDEVVTTQTRHLLSLLADYERKIVDVLPGLDLPDTAMDMREEYFLERIVEMRQRVEDLRRQRLQLTDLGRRIREQDRELSAYEQNERAAAADLQVATAGLDQLEQRETILSRQLREEAAAVQRLLEPLGLTFLTDEPLSPLLDALQSRVGRFVDQTEREAENQRRLRELGATIQQLERQETERGLERIAKSKALAAEQTSLEVRRQERQQLFGQRDPQAERARWGERLSQLRREVGEAQHLHQQLRVLLTSLEANRRQQEALLVQNEQRRSALNRELQNGLAVAGFVNIEHLFAARLLPPEAAALEQSATDLARRTTELAQSRRDVEQALARELSRDFTGHDRVQVEAQWQQAEAAYQSAQRDIGSLHRQLDENDRRGRDASELLVAVERQQEESQRWEALRELIGSHDGSAFRKFAQSLTLQQLVQRANRHLARLQGGRYRLQKQKDADLEIEIVDTYQADFLRSVSTLSGGETFLASLALALGLADMAGRHTRIQSLFIDEGFGALDENALELAITTLESLQAEGATIGIISHLRELKERISTQIQVIKRSDGFSEVRVTA